jgi:lantibiotic biosynthesis protein
VDGEILGPCWSQMDVARASSGVDEIASVLREQPVDKTWDASTSDFSRACLAHGALGIALFSAAAHELTADPAFLEQSRTSFDAAALATNRLESAASLYDGFVGTLWTACQLEQALGLQAEWTRAGDLVLLDALERWTGHFDFVSGLAGILVYAVEAHDGGDRRLIDAATQSLVGRATWQDDVCFWFSSPALLPPWQRERAPHGWVDLGIAHGVPGVIAALAVAAPVCSRPDDAMTAIEGGLRFLYRCEQATGPSRFPAVVTDRATPSRSRLGWCYGDLSVAWALITVGTSLGWHEPLDRGLDLALSASVRFDPQDTMVAGSGVCHGSAGCLHMFSRLYGLSGIERFRAAARYWFQDTIRWVEMLNGNVVGPPPSEVGFLNGLAGVGMVLLSVAGVPAEWDRALLLPSRRP